MSTTLESVVAHNLKKNVPDIHPGDTVRVHQIVREGTKERIQIFEGVVIARKGGSGISATFTVRKLSFGVGVERIFPLHSPRIVKIERTKSSQVRRAKLYYLRGLLGKAARLKNEKLDYAVWEEKGAEAEIEKIEEQVAAAAEAAAEEKAEESGELAGKGDVIEHHEEPMTDEAKAAAAAGEEVAASDLVEAETPEEVTHNEETNKS